MRGFYTKNPAINLQKCFGVLHNICQHFRIPWPDPDINEEENGRIYNFANHYGK
jgi:hypothetical protein